MLYETQRTKGLVRGADAAPLNITSANELDTKKYVLPTPRPPVPGGGERGRREGGLGGGGLEGEVWFDLEGNNWIDFAFHKMQLEAVKAWLAFLQRTQEQGFVPRDNSCRFL